MRNLLTEVTDQIVAALEAGAPTWVHPWSETLGLNTPCNAISGRPYSGVNKLLLWIAREQGWPTPRFLTFKQAKEAGGTVRKGEHGIGIVFTKDFTVQGETDDDGQRIRFLKRFTVFNTSQCDSLPEKIANPPRPRPRHRDGRDPLIEEFLASTRAVFQESQDGQAAYSRKRDVIRMPSFGAFDSAAAHYSTVFHELVHWTGHETRLNRDLKTRFKEFGYAAEELIAELGAAFICAEFSIDDLRNHTAYLGHYLDLLKADARAIFTCASAAQKAVDFLRDLALREPAQAAE